ncbi:hypothetical protein QVZ43_10535 [Marinobacter sp. chi1]|uniref:Uncharacterized protein n=1 Tax=Marinobacter suaedae TaxID=3057675 RepID=A0ABT8W1M7_9GAMM|nr:hypothetical protein [Marinobacter sp. chi1]MDO3722158.1 hypothetical protein [Marinobacter sp. chi1]
MKANDSANLIPQAVFSFHEGFLVKHYISNAMLALGVALRQLQFGRLSAA